MKLISSFPELRELSSKGSYIRLQADASPEGTFNRRLRLGAYQIDLR